VKVTMFPGQGSQRKGMGLELFGEFPQEVRLASEILGYSVTDVCANGSMARLSQTEVTQPVLFVVNSLMHWRQKTRSRAAAYLGHSLGEYNALLAAGVFDFEVGLQIVKKRGELMASADAVEGYGMAAIVKVELDEVREVLDEAEFHALDIANYNAPLQTVVSGPVASLEKLKAALGRRGRGVLVPLAVSAPFHSRYMRSIREAFLAYLKQFDFKEPGVPVISNATARPYQSGETIELLVEQLYSPVQWVQSVEYLLRQGASDFREVGPGDVLKRLVQQIIRAYTH